jgi:hypothetical protein
MIPVRTCSAAQEPHTPSPPAQDEVTFWRATAERLQAQNASQLSMLADLRAELEAIQQQAAAAAANRQQGGSSNATQDVRLLQAELQVCDCWMKLQALRGCPGCWGGGRDRTSRAGQLKVMNKRWSSICLLLWCQSC